MYTINVYLASPHCTASLRRWRTTGHDSQQLATAYVPDVPGQSELAHLSALLTALQREVERLRWSPL